MTRYYLVATQWQRKVIFTAIIYTLIVMFLIKSSAVTQ